MPCAQKDGETALCVSYHCLFVMCGFIVYVCVLPSACLTLCSPVVSAFVDGCTRTGDEEEVVCACAISCGPLMSRLGPCWSTSCRIPTCRSLADLPRSNARRGILRRSFHPKKLRRCFRETVGIQGTHRVRCCNVLH